MTARDDKCPACGEWLEPVTYADGVTSDACECGFDGDENADWDEDE